MVFPIFKLVGLFTKQVMKPLTNSLKSYASHNPYFARGCTNIARAYYQSYNSMCRTLRIPYNTRPIDEEQAIKFGVELLGESLVLSTAVGVMYYEYQKSSKSSNKTIDDYRKLEKRISDLEIILTNNEKNR